MFGCGQARCVDRFILLKISIRYLLIHNGCIGTILKAEADYELKQEFEEAIGGLKNGVIPLPYWTSYVDISKDEGSREWNTGSKENERHYLPLKKDHVLGAIQKSYFLGDYSYMA
jgi:hypothetical protein